MTKWRWQPPGSGPSLLRPNEIVKVWKQISFRIRMDFRSPVRFLRPRSDLMLMARMPTPTSVWECVSGVGRKWVWSRVFPVSLQTWQFDHRFPGRRDSVCCSPRFWASFWTRLKSGYGRSVEERPVSRSWGPEQDSRTRWPSRCPLRDSPKLPWVRPTWS